MHVGLDGYPLAEPRTGVGHYTLELARALARISPSDQFELVSPAAFQPAILDELAGDGLANLRAVHTKASVVRGRWWSVGLPLYVRRAKFDLFHGTNYEVPLWPGRRNVLTIHDLSTLLFPGKHRRRAVRRARLRLPAAARLAHKIITPVEAIRREVCEHLGVRPDKVVAIPSAARHSFQPVTAAQSLATRKRLGIEDDFLLFVGTLEPRKNLLSLLRALEQIVLTTALRPQLVIAGGEGWLMDETFSFIRNSSVGERLRLIGYLGDEDLRALYSSCRIFIYPSVYEGFGLPPLEAMACGAPVIASRIAALQENLGDAASFFEPADVAGLAESILELWADEPQRQKLSSLGKQQAEKYSWERTARLTLEVYRRVLEGSGKKVSA
jgi:glycosyltransferase involved in cell wall biosynthesis